MFLIPFAAAEEVRFLYQPPAAAVSAVDFGVDVGARPNGAVRFSDPGMGRNGFVQSVGGAWGATSWLTIGADARVSIGDPEDAPVSASAGAWARASRPGDSGVGVAGQLGAHREFGGVWALTAQGVVSVPIGPTEIALAPMVERRLDPEADPIDLLVPFAFGVTVAEGWQVGGEVVGQDLEDYFEEEEEEAEGGAVWLAALSAGWKGDRVEVGVAPGLSAGRGSVGFAGRVRLGWRF